MEQSVCKTYKPAGKPAVEKQRVAYLHSLQILDSDFDYQFERVTLTAAIALNTPMALVTLVDSDRQWFKSAQGLSVRETSRDLSFCSHIVMNNEPLIVPDASADERFSSNPMVTDPTGPKIRSYCGAPLMVRKDGEDLVLGTFCVIDSKPRAFAEHEIQVVMSMAEEVALMLNASQPRIGEHQTGVIEQEKDSRESNSVNPPTQNPEPGPRPVRLNDNRGVKVSIEDSIKFKQLRNQVGFEEAVEWLKREMIRS
mmetsp:Transcript_5843/g.9263  ORF Transcript_5843/g.9263 Transcript_5843/m.9263 type:complete len:254 (-) Transcript_5843:1205-1966(-)